MSPRLSYDQVTRRIAANEQLIKSLKEKVPTDNKEQQTIEAQLSKSIPQLSIDRRTSKELKLEASTDATMRSQLFTKCCELANTPPTRRQAAKFRSKRGASYQFINEARKQLAP